MEFTQTETTETKTAGVEKLAEALAKAQGKFTNPEKNKRGQCRGGYYMYATLDAVLDVVRKPLSDNGIALLQPVTIRDGHNVVLTQIIHSSGQFIEAIYRLPEGLGAQENGSAITYARRYQLCAMLGVAGETDDDGEAAQAAKESVDEEKKRLAAEKLKAQAANLKAAAAEGRLKSAHTGAPIKPSDVKPDGNVEHPAKEEPKQKNEEKAKPEDKPDGIPMEFSERLPVIDKRLNDKLVESAITLEQFMNWGIGKGNIPKGMTADNLEKSFLNVVIKSWPKVVQSIKGGK